MWYCLTSSRINRPWCISRSSTRKFVPPKSKARNRPSSVIENIWCISIWNVVLIMNCRRRPLKKMKTKTEWKSASKKGFQKCFAWFLTIRPRRFNYITYNILAQRLSEVWIGIFPSKTMKYSQENENLSHRAARARKCWPFAGWRAGPEGRPPVRDRTPRQLAAASLRIAPAKIVGPRSERNRAIMIVSSIKQCIIMKFWIPSLYVLRWFSRAYGVGTN